MRSLRRSTVTAAAVLTAAVPLLAVVSAPLAAQVASSKFCDGSYTVLGHTGGKDRFRGTVAAPAGRFLVQGRYTRFTVDPATFALYDYAFTGAANPGDLTGGRLTPVYDARSPICAVQP